MSTVSFSSPLVHTTYQPTASRCSPWLTPIVYFLGEHIVLPNYFRSIQVRGQHHLPYGGPVILAPTHRSRWDSIVLPLAAGRSVTGRDLHYMVTADEVKGIQGWFIRRLGGFAVNVRSPSIASLRHGIELLQQRKMVVIYPEGGIFRDHQLHRLKPGLARLALQSEAQSHQLGIKIVPVSIRYDTLYPHWGSQAEILFGPPLEVSSYVKSSGDAPLPPEELKNKARKLTEDLTAAIASLADSHSLNRANP